MDNLIDQSEKINMLSDLLIPDDRVKFDAEIKFIVSRMNLQMEQIRWILSQYNIPHEKIDDIDLDRRRQKIIWKILFPQYWNINQQIYSLGNDKLDQIEAILKNN